ncbi:MAG: thioesterase [Deltaproteobacteria bacterium CG12_big_fil_rev_8_21_14_0_65_43_10]|nr:MAG: thioesterase [Deltaproteobacteria bacterium CG2_30_43_15]PIQ46128.1 MAG: thioesterase [Deltaproteobacteria bacterium CG12_big_fil_rev_8_21_14_0_65_43_10]PIU86527.1 MAG: thioesterase [Deltaproteobacteria bacterium CG06_land_8_20_14_3_00_44_19]PIX26753.1 MAG: thioesterase [Deltaproteobacteria bacterium CG_4_8_14_3_um_filter_43_13]PIZ19246.1 MAG: thioesterase [Deltaproteobacteria bacterium CG_4_10_14_0_8_um_filter_43_12]HCX90964.1 thioesterase [Deltaproteobacteria bacterium]
MDKKVLEVLSGKIQNDPYARFLGIELIEINKGYSKLRMQIKGCMNNFVGIAHGGAIFSLADHAFAAASNSHGTLAVALNMSITYISAPLEDSVLVAEAKEVSLTSRTALYRIDVSTEDNKLIASCQGIVYRKKNSIPGMD